MTEDMASVFLKKLEVGREKLNLRRECGWFGLISKEFINLYTYKD
jgi:hypothetical protein